MTLFFCVQQCSLFTGITNHEEYSLVRDLLEEEKEKTLTLRRGQSIAKDQKKLDELKKKLHTDDECEYPYAIFIFQCLYILKNAGCISIQGTQMGPFLLTGFEGFPQVCDTPIQACHSLLESPTFVYNCWPRDTCMQRRVCKICSGTLAYLAF